MNIHCIWEDNRLMVNAGTRRLAVVDANNSDKEPCLEFVDGAYASLSFSEMEHIMDCWHNQPKN